MRQLQGAVLVCGDPDIETIVTLLSNPHSSSLSYTSFPLVASFDLEKTFDFLVVSRLPCLMELIKACKKAEKTLPIIIHLVHPRLLHEINYPELFPGVEVTPVPQASLDLMDITLKYDQFLRVIEKLLREQT